MNCCLVRNRNVNLRSKTEKKNWAKLAKRYNLTVSNQSDRVQSPKVCQMMIKIRTHKAIAEEIEIIRQKFKKSEPDYKNHLSDFRDRLERFGKQKINVKLKFLQFFIECLDTKYPK